MDSARSPLHKPCSFRIQFSVLSTVYLSSLEKFNSYEINAHLNNATESKEDRKKARIKDIVLQKKSHKLTIPHACNFVVVVAVVYVVALIQLFLLVLLLFFSLSNFVSCYLKFQNFHICVVFFPSSHPLLVELYAKMD